MYGIFTYIYHTYKPNVGKYAIHGAYGVPMLCFEINQTENSFKKEYRDNPSVESGIQPRINHIFFVQIQKDGWLIVV